MDSGVSLERGNPRLPILDPSNEGTVTTRE
jgi:hypothetical protein